MKTNILVLAAGNPEFENSDGGYPLCFTEHEGTSLLELIVSNTRGLKRGQYTFAFRDKDVEQFHLDHVVQLLDETAKVVRVPQNTRGSGCTALLAACSFAPDDEVLIVGANELVGIDLAATVQSFRDRNLDAGCLTFRSIHPRFSYVRLDQNGYVTEAAQQNPISHHATTGVFWFARAGMLIEAIKNSIRKEASTGGKFFIAPAFNEIILKQGKIGVQEIDNKQYFPLKTERQVHQFEYGGA